MGRAAVFAAAGAAFFAALALTVAGVGDRAAALPNWQALILGLVQGATELLPISSSGHLILVPWLGDWAYLKEDDLFNQTFDVSLHLGTLVAVVAYFRHDLQAARRGLPANAAAAANRERGGADRLVRRDRDSACCARRRARRGADRPPARRALADRHSCCPSSAGVLWLADRRPQQRQMSDLGMREAVAVGLAQCLSLLPGVSRSGVTITAGRFLALDRDSAARFSFLLLVPITLGAVTYKGVTDVVLGDLPPGMWGPFVVGSLASLASGLVAISALLGYVRRHDYTVFVVYRIVTGIVVLAADRIGRSLGRLLRTLIARSRGLWRSRSCRQGGQDSQLAAAARTALSHGSDGPQRPADRPLRPHFFPARVPDLQGLPSACRVGSAGRGRRSAPHHGCRQRGRHEEKSEPGNRPGRDGRSDLRCGTLRPSRARRLPQRRTRRSATVRPVATGARCGRISPRRSSSS